MKWNSNDGKEVISCDSEDLKQMVLANYQNTFRPGLKYYRIVCPRCLERNIAKGETKYDHRNLSISKEFTWGYCFRCNAIFTDKFYGANSEVGYDLSTFSGGESIDDFEIERINTTAYDDATPLEMHTEGIQYIQSRNPYYNVVTNQFKLRYKTNKLIIPYLDLTGKPFYYQFRYVDVSKSPNGAKYFNAIIGNKPIYIAPDSCGKPVWKTANTTILVEGALTAIALKIVLGDSFNIVCIMGKAITYYQVNFLKWLGLIGDLYVMMDETDLSQSVADELAKYKIKSNIIPTDGLDAEELLNNLGPQKYRNLLMSIIGDKTLHQLTFDSIYRNDFTNNENILNKKFSIKLKL